MATRVLVSTDGRASSRAADHLAVHLARALPMEVVLAHALALDKLQYKMIPDFQVEMIRQGAKRAAEQALEREAAAFRAEGLTVTPRLLVGEPGPALCDLARREKVALVVAGRRGQGDLQDILFGSVSNHLIHHCTTPVLVAKAPATAHEPWSAARPVRALVAVDGSSATQRCLDYLGSLSLWSEGLALTLLHVVNPDRPGLEHLPGPARFDALEAMHQSGQELLATSAERLRAAGFRVDTRVEQGSAGKTVCRVGQEDGYDLVVLGRRDTAGPAGVLFGSVCHFVIHHCPNHVLLVP